MNKIQLLILTILCITFIFSNGIRVNGGGKNNVSMNNPVSLDSTSPSNTLNKALGCNSNCVDTRSTESSTIPQSRLRRFYNNIFRSGKNVERDFHRAEKCVERGAADAMCCCLIGGLFGKVIVDDIRDGVKSDIKEIRSAI